MESEVWGGDLYQLQQEAIERAKETAKKAKKTNMPVKQHKSAGGLLKGLNNENLIIIAVLGVLLLTDCQDMMLILALALLIIL